MEDILLIPFGPNFLRAFAAVTGLGLFLVLEYAFPLRPFVDSKARRFFINLGLILLNVAIVLALYGDLFPRLCRFVTAHRIGLFNLFSLGRVEKTLLSVVVLDAATYLWHVANHAYALLWRFHRVHHSDPDLDVTTAFRFHWGEILASSFWKIGLVLLFGINVAGLLLFETLLLFAAQFQHSNLRLSGSLDRVLRWVFATPAMHQLHHSWVREESDSNYATIFSAWDRITGTYRCAAPPNRIGLEDYPRGQELTFVRLLFLPVERNLREPRRGPRESAALLFDRDDDRAATGR